MSYGWLTESSFHPQKQHEIALDKRSIDQAKARLLEEKKKRKQMKANDSHNAPTMPIPIKKKAIINTSISRLTKEQEVHNKLSLKERIYEKLAMNSELTNEEKEYKKRALIDFDSKRNKTEAQSKPNEKINLLLSNEFDQLFIFNVNNDEVANEKKKEPITNFLQLKQERDKNRYDRLQRIQKIKSVI